MRSLSSKFCDKESCHRPSCESKCLRTPSTTGNSPLSREGISSQVTGTRWTTSVIPSDVTVPGPHRRFDGALATPARCNLREERQEHVTDHVGRVASVDHGEDLLTLPAVPLLPAFGRELRGLSCCISRGWIHRLATRQRICTVAYVACQWKQLRSVSTLRLSGSDPLNPSIHWNTTLKRSSV